MKFITTLCRLLVGPLFIFSGWIKANDPLGFSYKLEEYFDVFHMPWLKDFALVIAIFLCVFEIGLGVAVLIGYRMKLFSWLLFLLIVFFSFLTFYSAYKDVVKDCGCFGDFMHLTPWTSFTKDMVLLVLSGTILWQRKKIQPAFKSDKTGMMVTAAGFVLSTAYSVYTYRHLSVVDFRPYKIGTNILEAMKLPPNAVTDSIVTKLVYKNLKTGEKKEFTSKDYPWQDSLNWKWDTTINKVIREGTKPAIHDFAIRDMLGGDVDDNDTLYTRRFLTDPKYSFMLISYDLKKADKDKDLMKMINDFYDGAKKDSLSFIAITASDPKMVDNLKHEFNALYDFYNNDETALKTMIRSNPGLIMLKKGTVIAMWHHNDFPKYEDVKAKYFK